jgi:hypothetical protein
MIQPQYQNLSTLFSDRVFRIPKYQRYYSWEQKQRSDLFSDIEELRNYGTDRDHFMATIVCFKTSEIREIGSKEYRIYDIVDGQQRITTLIMLLKALHLAIEEQEEKDEIGKIIVKKDGVLVLLQTNNVNQHIFNNFLCYGNIPKKSELKTFADRNLYLGIEDCITFVKRWADDYGDVLSLLRIVRNKLGFVVYDTDSPQVVYSVFEVLNSRGLAVDWLDKCKSSLMGIAYNLSKTGESKDTFIVRLNDLWGNIYNEIALHPVSGQEILRVTATIYTGDEAGKPKKAESALRSLKERCQAPEDTIHVSNWIYNVAKTLVKLHSDIHLGPVTNILQARVLGVAILLTDSMIPDEQKIILKQWEKITFRIYGLFGNDARTKVGDYIRLANNIMNKSAGASRYSEIINAIQKIGEHFPVEKAINEKLRGQNIYEANQNVVRYLLWLYEEHLANQAGKNAVVNEEFKREIWEARSANDSIEHIMPQNMEPGGAWDGKVSDPAEYERYVNCIGNLILLPPSLNSEANRNGFLAKKSIYSRSEGLRHVKEVIQQSDWGQAEIREREEKLLSWIRDTWKDVSL